LRFHAARELLSASSDSPPIAQLCAWWATCSRTYLAWAIRKTGVGGCTKTRLPSGRASKIRPSILRAAAGKGQFLFGENLETLLDVAQIPPEAIVNDALRVDYIRRRREDDTGHLYFFANHGNKTLDGWVTLSVPAQSATLFDPCTTGAARRASGRKTGKRRSTCKWSRASRACCAPHPSR
jgi:hypothetical protein